MQFVFLIMGDYAPQRDHVAFHQAQMTGVSSVEEACRTARRLQEQGVDCIELCGAFGPEGAQAVIDATENRLPVGYVVHLPQQDPLFRALFG